MVGFLRRNVKKQRVCVFVCVCVKGGLLTFAEPSFNRDGSQPRTSFSSCCDRERERHEHMSREEREEVCVHVRRPGVVGSDWTWVGCPERHWDGEGEGGVKWEGGGGGREGRGSEKRKNRVRESLQKKGGGARKYDNSAHMHEKYGIHQEYHVLMIPPHRRHKRITPLSLFKLELRCKWHPSRGARGPVCQQHHTRASVEITSHVSLKALKI